MWPPVCRTSLVDRYQRRNEILTNFSVSLLSYLTRHVDKCLLVGEIIHLDWLAQLLWLRPLLSFSLSVCVLSLERNTHTHRIHGKCRGVWFCLSKKEVSKSRGNSSSYCGILIIWGKKEKIISMLFLLFTHEGRPWLVGSTSRQHFKRPLSQAYRHSLSWSSMKIGKKRINSSQ